MNNKDLINKVSMELAVIFLTTSTIEFNAFPLDLFPGVGFEGGDANLEHRAIIIRKASTGLPFPARSGRYTLPLRSYMLICA